MMIRYRRFGVITAALAMMVGASLAWAHSGGMAKDGAHRDRATGERHWHLEIPCISKPCNVGFVDAEILGELFPVPDGCDALVEQITAEGGKSYWTRSEGSISGWALRGVRLRCWKTTHDPPKRE